MRFGVRGRGEWIGSEKGEVREGKGWGDDMIRGRGRG
jgi:hypothetical protein